MQKLRVIMKALTAEMDLALRGPSLELRDFPYRLGRECRARESRPLPPGIAERRAGHGSHNNDLYILESGSRLFVSRQHLLLEQRSQGLYLVDLFSACGTIVEGRYVGGDHKGGEIALESHDVVIIGTANSPYIFKVLLG